MAKLVVGLSCGRRHAVPRCKASRHDAGWRRMWRRVAPMTSFDRLPRQRGDRTAFDWLLLLISKNIHWDPNGRFWKIRKNCRTINYVKGKLCKSPESPDFYEYPLIGGRTKHAQQSRGETLYLPPDCPTGEVKLVSSKYPDSAAQKEEALDRPCNRVAFDFGQGGRRVEGHTALVAQPARPQRRSRADGQAATDCVLATSPGWLHRPSRKQTGRKSY